MIRPKRLKIAVFSASPVARALQTTSHAPNALLPIALFLFACGPSSVGFDGGETLDGGADSPAPIFQLEDAHFDAPAPTEAGSCDPPDMLVILDRSERMSVNVGTQGTRINLAMGDQHDHATANGSALARAPDAPGDRRRGVLDPARRPDGLAHRSSITHALGTMSPQLDYGPPIGGALTSALGTFAKNKVGTRKQYVLLLTDGGECCSCNTNDYDIGVAQQLYAGGRVRGRVRRRRRSVLLNDLACAGHTLNFNGSCTCTSAGCRASTSINASTTPLYLKPETASR